MVLIKEFERTCSIVHCLSMSRRKMYACASEENKCSSEYVTRNVALLHVATPFSVLFFPVCILLLCPHSAVSLSSKAQGQGMDGPEGAVNRTRNPNRGLMSEYLCVFQGSAGA